MGTKLYLDGTDSADLGVYVAPPDESWLGAPDLTFESSSTPLRPGGAVSRYPVSNPRALGIPIRVMPTAYTAPSRELAERDIKALQGKLMRVRLDDGSTAKEIVGRLFRVKLRPVNWPTAFISAGELQFLCPDPTWSRIGGTSITLGTTRRILTLGNAPVADWILELVGVGGSVTDVTVTIRDQGGATLRTMVWTGTIGAGEYGQVISSTGVMRRRASSAWVTHSTMTGGFPVFDPLTAPTVQLSAVSGTPGGVLRYCLRDW